jgi:hypothetical protein|tara:strand:- start:1438 stop:1884 length:447 start_codon:yes stop_codon:yes gene_type:complete
MTKKDLVKIIREVVRREVQKEVQKIFIKEESSPSLKEILPEVTKQVSSPKKEVKYSNNSTINNILNETKALSKSQKDEYPTMSGGAFDTSKMAELIGYGKPEEVKRDMVAVDTFKRAGITSEQVPEHITNALTRDYSGLMKALDKKGK